MQQLDQPVRIAVTSQPVYLAYANDWQENCQNDRHNTETSIATSGDQDSSYQKQPQADQHAGDLVDIQEHRVGISIDPIEPETHAKDEHDEHSDADDHGRNLKNGTHTTS